MILVIDNYDSFTYNLVHYLRELGAEVEVVRNDALTVPQALALRPQAVLLSPGPKAPDDAGICLDMIRAAAETGLPLFGVCLGHQSIGQLFGGRVVRAQAVMHGKTSAVSHDGSGVFEGLPQRFSAGRYHSLIVETRDASPLIVTAHSEEGEVMGLRHREHPTFGVQFHPESILTEHGYDMLRNFLRVTQ